MENDIKNALDKVVHPAIECSLSELGMLRSWSLDGNKISVTMAYPFPGIPIKAMLELSVRNALEPFNLEITFGDEIMNEEEKNKFMDLERKNWKSDIGGS
jgi:metal-sulfur cluster biosynthetic enzyme